MPEGLKVATTPQEILRRLKTSGEYLPKETAEEILKAYMDNLSAMGYLQAWKKKVLRTTMIGYMRVLTKSRKGETSRNRKGKDTQVSRRFKKLLGNQYWFRMGDQPGDKEVYSGGGLAPMSGRLQGRKDAHQDKRYVESVVFVPYTPEGNLRNRLNRVQDKV